MEKRPKIPNDVIEEIKLKEPKSEKKVVKVSQTKSTNQFSIKIPSSISMELGLKKSDKFEINITDKNILTLTRLRK